MTDESYEPGQPEDRDPPQMPEPEAPADTEIVEERGPEATASGVSDFTGNEGMVAMAGLLLLAVWLIFEVIIGEYFIPTVGILLALAVALLPRIRRETVEKVHRLNVLMKIAGYALAFVGLIEIIDDLRFEAYDDFISVLGALGAYAAYAMAFLGARSIKI